MTTDTDTIQEIIKEYVQQATFGDRDKIENDSLLFKDGYFDSMGFVVLITFLEDKFGIKTVDKDLTEENFESINAITDFVIRKKS